MSESMTDEIKIVSEAGLSWVPEKAGISDELGHLADDPSIMSVAADQSPCFGKHFHQSEKCKGCALAHLCSNTTKTFYETLSWSLDKKTVTRIELAQKELRDRISARKAAEEKRLRDEERDRRIRERNEFLKNPSNLKPADNTHDLIPIPFDGVCTKCGLPIPEGELGAHVKKMGLFHPGCVPTTKDTDPGSGV